MAKWPTIPTATMPMPQPEVRRQRSAGNWRFADMRRWSWSGFRWPVPMVALVWSSSGTRCPVDEIIRRGGFRGPASPYQSFAELLGAANARRPVGKAHHRGDPGKQRAEAAKQPTWRPALSQENIQGRLRKDHGRLFQLSLTLVFPLVTAVGTSIGAAVRTSVRVAIAVAVRAPVGTAVRIAVAAAIRASVAAAVRAPIGAAVRISVAATIRASVSTAIRASIGAAV